MPILLRCANLDADEQLITEFLARNHTKESNQKRFDWLYRRGPAGQARAWISHDSETQNTVGVAAAFPRRMYFHGRDELGWVLGDFCIDSRYRSLGPAVQLQRECLADLNSDCRPIYYDFPSASMTAIYRRLGILPRHDIVRLVKLLRVDGKIQRLIGQPQLARMLSSVVNTGLAVFNGSQTRDGLIVSIHPNACGDDFTRLAHNVGSSFGICLRRSADYLNWRFREHPYRVYEILTLRQSDSLVAYGVVCEEGVHLSMVDLFGEAWAIPEVVRAVIAVANDRKLETVRTGVLGSPSWMEIFRELGFFLREKSPVVVGYTDFDPAVSHGAGWFLTDGDRES